MSTETGFLSPEMVESLVYALSGLFGGFFPIMFDFIHRQKQPKQEKIELDREFYLVKGVVIPLGSLFITAFAIYGGNISTWLAGLYLGASFPVLIGKVIGSSSSTIENLGQGQ